MTKKDNNDKIELMLQNIEAKIDKLSMAKMHKKKNVEESVSSPSVSFPSQEQKIQVQIQEPPVVHKEPKKASEYGLYVKKRMPELIKEYSGKENKVRTKDLMPIIAKEWRLRHPLSKSE